MGSGNAPFFANLFLYFNEGQWLINKSGFIKARRFYKPFRFIDGQNCFGNLNNTFQSEIVLIKENDIQPETPFKLCNLCKLCKKKLQSQILNLWDL